jgi:hypothetical protein
MLKRERILQVLSEIYEFTKNQTREEEDEQLSKLLNSAAQEFNTPCFSNFIFWYNDTDEEINDTDEEIADIILSIPQEKTPAEQVADRFKPANLFFKDEQDNESVLQNLEVNGFRFSLKPQSVLNGNYVVISYPDGLSLGFVEMEPDKIDTIRQYDSIEDALAQTEESLKLLTTNTPLTLLRLSYPYDKREFDPLLYKLIISRRCLNDWKPMSFSQWDHRKWWHPRYVKHITNFQGTDEEFIPLLTKVLERIDIILIEISPSEYTFPQTIPILPLT